MSKVRIVQLLCPERHCIISTAYESPDGAEIPEIAQRLRERFEEMVKAGLNPWCGICLSRKLEPEDRPSIFATMKEAIPHLREAERLQAQAREYFKARKN